MEYAELLCNRGEKPKPQSRAAHANDAMRQAMSGGSKPRNDYKAEFEQQLSLVGIRFEKEFVFAPPRKFRADYRIIGSSVLVEYEGGLFAKGKAEVSHAGVQSILGDMEKANLAQLGGWVQIRIAPNHVVSGQALKWVEDAIKVVGSKS